MFRPRTWGAVALVGVLLLTGCGANPSNGHYNQPAAPAQPSSQAFSQALARAGYSGAQLSYDKEDRKWSAIVRVSGCRVEIDEIRKDEVLNGFEIDQIGSKDNITAASLRLRSLMNVSAGLLAGALTTRVMHNGRPVPIKSQFGC